MYVCLFVCFNWTLTPFRKAYCPAVHNSLSNLAGSIINFYTHPHYVSPVSDISHFFTPSSQKKLRKKNHLFKYSLVQDDQVITSCNITFYANAEKNLDKNWGIVLVSHLCWGSPEQLTVTGLLFLMHFCADTWEIFKKHSCIPKAQ